MQHGCAQSRLNGWALLPLLNCIADFLIHSTGLRHMLQGLFTVLKATIVMLMEVPLNRGSVLHHGVSVMKPSSIIDGL
jgi:hypothetical protein